MWGPNVPSSFVNETISHLTPKMHEPVWTDYACGWVRTNDCVRRAMHRLPCVLQVCYIHVLLVPQYCMY